MLHFFADVDIDYGLLGYQLCLDLLINSGHQVCIQYPCGLFDADSQCNLGWPRTLADLSSGARLYTT
jgi:hypothetical protein